MGAENIFSCFFGLKLTQKFRFQTASDVWLCTRQCSQRCLDKHFIRTKFNKNSFLFDNNSSLAGLRPGSGRRRSPLGSQVTNKNSILLLAKIFVRIHEIFINNNFNIARSSELLTRSSPRQSLHSNNLISHSLILFCPPVHSSGLASTSNKTRRSAWSSGKPANRTRK